jgi:hypothetical protein
VVCKSARRAGAVVAAYRAKKLRVPVDAVLAEAQDSQLTFLQSAGLTEWVSSTAASAASDPAYPLLFRQLFEKESSTYTYLLADSYSKEAILIDPVLETVERLVQVL